MTRKRAGDNARYVARAMQGHIKGINGTVNGTKELILESDVKI